MELAQGPSVGLPPGVPTGLCQAWQSCCAADAACSTAPLLQSLLLQLAAAKDGSRHCADDVAMRGGGNMLHDDVMQSPFLNASSSQVSFCLCCAACGCFGGQLALLRLQFLCSSSLSS